jgi:ketosteroid isomerase-like protein
MSQENVEAARRLYKARNRGDVEAVLAECHPQAEWHPHLSSLGGRPVQGHVGIREYLRSLGEEWAKFRHEPEEFFDAGDRVVAFLHTSAVGRTSGVEVDMPVAHLLTFESGRCIKSVSYVDRSEALEAVGLRE